MVIFFGGLGLLQPPQTLIFVLHHGSGMAYLLHYVDDIVLTASSAQFLRAITSSPHLSAPSSR